MNRLCTFRRDDLAVDDAVAEVRARRHGRLARGAAGTREADVPERRKFGDLHKLDEEYGAGPHPRHLACAEIKLSRRGSATQCWLISALLIPLCIAFVSKMNPPPRLPVIGTTS